MSESSSDQKSIGKANLTNNETTSPDASELKIKFKSTNTSHEVIELEFEEQLTVFEYKEKLCEKLGNPDPFNIKLVYKGKVLTDKQKAGDLNLQNNTVMMVVSSPKGQSQPKPSLSSEQQKIPNAGISTGLGSSSPVGFGGYGIVNHPQYMSAISEAVNEESLEEKLDDPYYQSMIEQMMEDPETMRQLMEDNPMTKQLMKENPMMKMVMENPAMMKMVFNKDTIKMAKEWQKNGGTANIGDMSGANGTAAGFGAPQMNNPMMSSPMFNPMMGGMGGFGGMNMFGGMNGLNSTQSSNQSSGSSQQNSFPSFPVFGMNNNGNSQGGNLNPFMSMFNMNQPQSDAEKYKSQIKQLNSMGFSNESKNIRFLKESDGDLDKALEKLCLDDDENPTSNQQKKSQN